MKAFRITWDRKRPTLVDAACRYDLPRIECLECCPEWKTWGVACVSFPALKFYFLNTEDYNCDRVVSLEEFRRIAERISRTAGRLVPVAPGSGIGELEGTATTSKLDDFTWGRVVLPEISLHARDALAGEGIELLTAECSILYRCKRIETQLAVQLEPVELLTEESLNRHRIIHCQRCGNYMAPPRPAPVVPEGYKFNRSLWPKGAHLVQTRETGDVLASQEFIDAVKKHDLRGIVFKECGEFV